MLVAFLARGFETHIPRLNSKLYRVEWLDKDTGIRIEKWIAVRYRKFIETVEPLIGRKLTRKECSTIAWLCGFELESVNDLIRIIEDACQNGQVQIKQNQ